MKQNLGSDKLVHGNLLTFWCNGNLLTFWSNLFSNHVANDFCDIFINLCHIGSFINCNGRKLTNGWTCHTFFTFGNSNLNFHLSRMNLLALYTFKGKNDYLLLNYILPLYEMKIRVWQISPMKTYWHFGPIYLVVMLAIVFMTFSFICVT